MSNISENKMASLATSKQINRGPYSRGSIEYTVIIPGKKHGGKQLRYNRENFSYSCSFRCCRHNLFQILRVHKMCVCTKCKFLRTIRTFFLRIFVYYLRRCSQMQPWQCMCDKGNYTQLGMFKI